MTSDVIKGREGQPNFKAPSQAFGQAHIEFIDENGGGPGVRLRKRQRPKKTK